MVTRWIASPSSVLCMVGVMGGLFACGNPSTSGSETRPGGEEPTSTSSEPVSPLCEVAESTGVLVAYSDEVEPFACDLANPPPQATTLTPPVLAGLSSSGLSILFDDVEGSGMRMFTSSSGGPFTEVLSGGKAIDIQDGTATYELSSSHPDFSAGRVELPLVENPSPPPMLRFDFDNARLSILHDETWEDLKTLEGCEGIEENLQPTEHWLALEFLAESPDLGTWFVVTRLEEFGGPRFEEHHFVFYGPPDNVTQRKVLSLTTSDTGALDARFETDAGEATASFAAGCPRFQPGQQCDGTLVTSVDGEEIPLVSHLPEQDAYLPSLSFRCAFSASR
jgi:hypothetical protein